MSEEFDELEIEIIEEEELEKKETETEVIEKHPKREFTSGERINLFFRSTIGPGEKLEKLMVDPNMAVKDLCETVGQLFGLDSSDFFLSIHGRTLDMDDVLSNYDIDNGIEVLLIPVSTAGK